VLFPSLEEAQVITGLNEPDTAASALGEFTPLVVLTNGGSEILVVESGEITRVAIQRADVVDPTGAGDAFAAGFLDEWTRSGDAVAAATAGATVAARSIALVGGRPA
jgi:sugar/nucleoside kinase (ribokinase family)